MNKVVPLLLGVVVCLAGGCSWQLLEVRGKTKFGPEFRDRSNRTSEVRWTSIQQGFEFKWDSGWKSGITYRRRDTDAGSGGNDNGIWFDISYPLWKKPKKQDVSAKRLDMLERQLAQLKMDQASQAPGYAYSRSDVSTKSTTQ